MFKEIKEYLDQSKDVYVRAYKISNRGLLDLKVNGANYSYRATFSGNVAHLRKGDFDDQTGKEFILSENRISLDEYNQIKELIKGYI